jgi:hypothetical protein
MAELFKYEKQTADVECSNVDNRLFIESLVDKKSAQKGGSKAMEPIKKKAHYPLNISFTTVLQADDGPSTAANGVIRDEDGLRRLRRRHADLLIGWADFAKEQLIFVALGEREPGSEVQIMAVSHISDRGEGRGPLTEVAYREKTAGTPAPYDETSNPSPIHVIKVKKLEGDTVFSKGR